MTPLKKKKFCIEESAWYEGYHDPEIRWNGWACPYFTFDQAKAMCEGFQAEGEAFNKEFHPGNPDAEAFKWVYVELLDCFVIGMADGEPEAYGAHQMDTEDGPMKLYAIGAWGWVWMTNTDF